MLHVRVYLCPLEYRGCATPGGWVTPKNLYFRGFGAAVNHHSVAASWTCSLHFFHPQNGISKQGNAKEKVATPRLLISVEQGLTFVNLAL